MAPGQKAELGVGGTTGAAPAWLMAGDGGAGWWLRVMSLVEAPGPGRCKIRTCPCPEPDGGFRGPSRS